MKFAKAIEKILQQHQARGQQRFHSGELNLAGRNYAGDILQAVDFARIVVAEFDFSGNPTDIDRIVALFEQGKSEFEKSHPDPEGFGYGTLVDIVNDIQALRE